MFKGLQKNHYGVILADPPWTFHVWSDSDKAHGSAKAHYNTMSAEDIMNMPVADLATPDCMLFMWVCWPNLLESLETIKAWGFEYKTCEFMWMKADVSTINMFDDPIDAYMGLGHYTRANSEACLLATRGKPKHINADVRQGIIAPRREYGRKPEGVHERIERLAKGPYCELFARQQRKGWDVWGNQTNKFKEFA